MLSIWIIIGIVIVLVVFVVVRNKQGSKYVSGSAKPMPPSSERISSELPLSPGGRVSVGPGFGTGTREGGKTLSTSKAPEKRKEYSDDDDASRLKKAKPFRQGDHVRMDKDD